MPVKKGEPYTLNFAYKGKIYHLDTFRIFKKGKYICNCDLTATDYYGNELITRICCEIALDAYYAGKADGKIEHRDEVGKIIKNLFGL